MRIICCLLALATVLEAAPDHPQHNSASSDACGQAAKQIADQIAADPNSQFFPKVPAQLAYDCLQSVPNKAGPSADLIKSLKVFASWQSTRTYLKNPPPTYPFPAVDIDAGLDTISTTATNGGYKNEYDFGVDLLKLWGSAHDVHLGHIPDVFKVFEFRNQLTSDLVSISIDGKSPPTLHHIADLYGENSTGVAPAITKINGIDAAQFIETQNAEYSFFQDPDSQWNSVFPTYATSRGFLFVARAPFFQGPSVTVTYDNGQEETGDSFAIVQDGIDLTGVTTGEDFYNKFCTPTEQQDSTANTDSSPSNSANDTAQDVPPNIQGFPTPVIRDGGAGAMAGYFLEGSGYDDVAVLSILAFAPLDMDMGGVEYMTDYQKVLASFLNKAQHHKKKKLIIDLQANDGGYVFAAFETFLQLFPGVPWFEAYNMRLSDGIVDIANALAAVPANYTPQNDEENAAFTTIAGSTISTNLLPGSTLKLNSEQFQSVEEIITPVTIYDDKFSPFFKLLMNDDGEQFNLTGFGDDPNPPPAVFAPEDIVLLTDGTCGSACTIFAYMMTDQKNIKTTVAGGRPTTGPMQAVAGVEGSQVAGFDEISDLAAATILLAPADQKKALKEGNVGILAEGLASKRAANLFSPGSINLQNAFRQTDAQVPLQFLDAPANCRVYYTKDSLMDPDKMWKQTVDASFTDPQQFCVEGSIVPVDTSIPNTIDPAFGITQATIAKRWTSDFGESLRLDRPHRRRR